MACVEHKQKGNPRGYAMARYMGRQMALHRKMYCLTTGTHPDEIDGLVMRHTCDNPRCINPAHLVPGTQQDNMDDMTERNRQAVGTGHGLAVLDEDAVRFIRKHYKARDPQFGCTALARRFGAGASAVSAVIRGATWTHIK